MRDRLIELIQDSVGGCARYWAEIIADNLLANGVIVPPCKVGDTVHVIEDAFCRDAIFYNHEHICSKLFAIGKVVSITKKQKQLLMKIRVVNSIGTRYKHQKITVNAIGKTVFLTREEAEKALKEAQG